MIAKIYSIIPTGVSGTLVRVEGDKAEGLPNFNLVGLASKTVSEARERVRSALKSSGFTFPAQKITVSLAPAELAKDGPHLDLPIALSVMVLSGQLAPADVKDAIFVGELSLEGQLRPVRGIVNIIEAAREKQIKTAFIPAGNLASAALVPGVKVVGVSTLSELFAHLKGEKPIQNPRTSASPPLSPPELTLDDIQGQALAKRALEIAVAGHHNLLLSGPPGAGKTLLARASISLLPPLSPTDRISVTKLHELSEPSHVIMRPPFRAPHHTASPASIIGGGPKVLPGEISLAHLGILFLDELPEFPKNVLEALRQPLEDHFVTVSRAHQKLTYPAGFMLIAAMNPCPCGYLGDRVHPCTCSNNQIDRYRRKLSGPLLDRIDLYLSVDRVDPKTLLKKPTSSRPEQPAYQAAVQAAIDRQIARGPRNSELTLSQIKDLCKIAPAAQTLLDTAAEKLALSARSYLRTLRVAQTIADLENSPEIREPHLSEALSFRPQL